MFVGSRLDLARMLRGLNKTQLAKSAGVSTKTITAYIAGESTPRPVTLGRLADALRFPVSFFEQDELELIPAEAASFRARRRMTASERNSALSAGRMAIELSNWIDAKYRLPEADLPPLESLTPDDAAVALRAEWGLGDKPIGNMLHLLELRGVRIFSLLGEAQSVDAFSLWNRERPYVFLNTSKSAERSRFDAAHELGHLVLHQEDRGDLGGRERDADKFASAFLMPESSVRRARCRPPSLPRLLKLKKRWKVSIAALVYRLHALEIISAWENRTLFIEMSKRGYRKREPNGISYETSQILRKVLDDLRSEGHGLTVVAQDLHVRPDVLRAIVTGLVPVRA